MKRSDIVKIIKEEISNTLKEQEGVDKVEAQIKQRVMQAFKDLLAVGLPRAQAKAAAMKAHTAAYNAKDTSKIPGIIARIQSDAHLAHIGVSNKMPEDPSSSALKAKSPLSTRARTKLDKRGAGAQEQMDRAQQVLKIVSPNTPADTISMTGRGQKMELNGVKIPPKYVAYVISGGPLPK